MSLMETLKLWDTGVKLWDDQNPEKALSTFSSIEEPSAKILFNIGCVHLHQVKLQEALKSFNQTISRDEHLVVAYFQRAITYYKLKQYEDSLHDFHECHHLLRGRPYIDYTQLGLRCKLYLCEFLNNLAVVHSHLGNLHEAHQMAQEAVREKVEKRHGCLDENLTSIKMGSIPPLIELPVDAIFRPPKSKVANMGKKNYLGKAQVVSAVDDDKFSGFDGPRKKEAGLIPTSLSNPTSPVPKRKQKMGFKSQDNSPELPRKQPSKENIQPKFQITSRNPPDKPIPPPPTRYPPTAAIYELEKVVFEPEIHYPSRGAKSVDNSPELNRKLQGTKVQSQSVSDLLENPHSKSFPPHPKKLPPKTFVFALEKARREPPTVPHESHSLPHPKIPNKDVLSADPKTVRSNVVTSGPPTRPPPKLRNKPVAKAPEENERRPAVKPPGTVVPSTENKNPLPLPPRKRKVSLQLHCNTTVTVEVEFGATLYHLVQVASQEFQMTAEQFDLWFKRLPDGQMEKIANEMAMKKVWKTVNNNNLSLWCYGKQ